MITRKVTTFLLLFAPTAKANKAMQEAMQGKVHKDIFKNNSYLCNVKTNKKSSKMSLAFKGANFKFSHLEKEKKIQSLWYGSYQLLKTGDVLFKTKEFRMKGPFKEQVKREGEVLFEVEGNASLFKLRNKEVIYSCARARY
ncbi:MAG: hypothetical protein ACJAT2_000284 [Bacteriovoracaceae bacterium]